MNQFKMQGLPLPELVDKLLEFNIGEHGRLIYLQNHLLEGKPIYDSDKRFLQICLGKLQELEGGTIKPENLEMNHDDKYLHMINKLLDSEIGDTGRLRLIKQNILEGKPLVESDELYFKEKYEQFAQIDENEKTTREALVIIKKLKQSEIGNSERLDSIKEKLEQRIVLPIPDIRYFNEKAKELKRLQIENGFSQSASKHDSKIKMKSKFNGTISSPFTFTVKISDVMLASATIIYAIWVLGLFLIDISPVQDHLLGLALGLGAGVVVIYKIQKKASQSFNR
ncbi:MAG: hypothetical protein YK1312THETA_2430008 [Marine Group I thaumarchaeote]|nr:MAG: hypothetical protein YK1312THETA_2430008 [Marine Group I thaumarchaeote]